MILIKIILLVLFSIEGKSYNLDTFYPIIYRFPRDGQRRNYFGMTVALLPGANSWVLQVGAPRGNVTGVNVNEPGAVYRCQLFGPCDLFVVDNKGNTPGVNKYFRYKDRKNEGWTGVSMDLKYFNGAIKTVICGSRWSNQNLTNDDNIGVTYLMTGVCYLQDVCNCEKEEFVYKLLPLVNPDKIYYPKPYAYDKSFYYWGLGQSGISSTLLDDLSGVLMGAPGYNNWLGTVVWYNTDLRWFDFKVGLFEDTREFKRNAYPYIGYQVSYGRFFGDKRLWFLAGAPRAENYHGKVLIFQFKDFSSEVHIQSELVGSTFGEYFGSALAVLDINNDGFDDLVVGAPLFFRKHPEEGRIYVYLGTNRGNFLFRSQVINGRSGYSRFGTCITSLGDLDQDGYRDVAVGAPYENGGRGAIYVYRGSKKGLEMEYSQRIPAQEISPSLRGFGISMSKGVDVDENGYNDLAIGAYLSDEVVILRSQPIVHLHPVVRLEDISLLDRTAKSFNISICLRYSGSNAPTVAGVIWAVEVDPKGNRAVITGANNSMHTATVFVPLNGIKCDVLNVAVNHDLANFEPLQISLKTELGSCHNNTVESTFVWGLREENKFIPFCPIGRKKEVYTEVPYAGECGADNVCQAELELFCDILQMKKTEYLVVTSDTITLFMELRNTGEPAHNTDIIITSNLDLIHNEDGDGNQEQVPRSTFEIDVASEFRKYFRVNFTFRIATESLKLEETMEWRKTHLNLRIEAHTTSFEDFVGDNICNINLNLLSDATVDLFSSSAPTSSFNLKNTTELNFTLYYEVQKKGDTPVSDAELNIFIPTYLQYGSQEIEFSTVSVETSEWIYSSINDEAQKERDGPSEVDIVWHNLNSTNASLPAARTVFFNCSMPGIRCKTVSVIFPDGIPSQISSNIKIFVSLNMSSIGFLLEEKNILHFTTVGDLGFRKLFEIDAVQMFSQSSVTFYKEEEPKKVEAYVIALSAAAGGLLLFLIVSALFKSEFFRRKKKEELEALKSEELRRQSNYEFPPEIIGEGGADAKE